MDAVGGRNWSKTALMDSFVTAGHLVTAGYDVVG